MRLGIVGGNLQGLEAAYLAGKAGWETVVVDQRAQVPAAGLSGLFVVADAAVPEDLDQALRGVDLVLPALEDREAIESLVKWSGGRGIPLAFDQAAFLLSASKPASNRLFAELGIATPAPWPGCGFPVLAKPGEGSGSRGVRVCRSAEELRRSLSEPKPSAQWVVQELLLGPSYSLEVLGRDGCYRPLQVTELNMDRTYDCKRVIAPCPLAGPLAAELEDMAVRTASAVGLTGLMDLEVILDHGKLKALEIDARLPSQTPTAVFWSTGVNMVELLGELFLQRRAPESKAACRPRRAVVYEHLHAAGGALEVSGEHCMSGASGIRLEPGFFGATEALTNYRPACGDWVATLIVTGADREQAWARRCRVIQAIRDAEGIEHVRDEEPVV